MSDIALNTPTALPDTGSLADERRHRQRAVLIVVLASYMMIILDTSIVITGLPDIRDGLGFSPTGLSWVQNAYRDLRQQRGRGRHAPSEPQRLMKDGEVGELRPPGHAPAGADGALARREQRAHGRKGQVPPGRLGDVRTKRLQPHAMNRGTTSPLGGSEELALHPMCRIPPRPSRNTNRLRRVASARAAGGRRGRMGPAAVADAALTSPILRKVKLGGRTLTQTQGSGRG